MTRLREVGRENGIDQDMTVLCDESGHTKFPFSYHEHVTLLTLAQARISPCPGFAPAGSPVLTLTAIFGRLGAACRITSTLAEGLELGPYIKMAKMCPTLKLTV
jgi:hypothetical protein